MVEKKSEKHHKYCYKTLFYILLGVLILGVVMLGSYVYSQDKYMSGVQFGQQNAINIVLSEIVSKGYITISTQEGNITLVPSQTVALGQKQIVDEIVNSVTTRGFVTITSDQNQTLVLVQAQPQQ
jgi:hypothetical protein